MEIIPLNAIPSQTLSVQLGDQNCQINVYQKSTGLFLDLSANGVAIVNGVLCENLNRIVRSAYLGFVGDLTFIDNHGDEDPVFTGLDHRFSLAYMTEDELT